MRQSGAAQLQSLASKVPPLVVLNGRYLVAVGQEERVAPRVTGASPAG